MDVEIDDSLETINVDGTIAVKGGWQNRVDDARVHLRSSAKLVADRKCRIQVRFASSSRAIGSQLGLPHNFFPLVCLVSVVALSMVALGQSSNIASEAQRAERALLTGNFSQAVSLYSDLAGKLPENTGIALDLALALP
jgi:hypothetical protein